MNERRKAINKEEIKKERRKPRGRQERDTAMTADDEDETTDSGKELDNKH